MVHSWKTLVAELVEVVVEEVVEDLESVQVIPSSTSEEGM